MRSEIIILIHSPSHRLHGPEEPEIRFLEALSNTSLPDKNRRIYIFLVERKWSFESMGVQLCLHQIYSSVLYFDKGIDRHVSVIWREVDMAISD